MPRFTIRTVSRVIEGLTPHEAGRLVLILRKRSVACIAVRW